MLAILSPARAITESFVQFCGASGGSRLSTQKLRYPPTIAGLNVLRIEIETLAHDTGASNA